MFIVLLAPFIFLNLWLCSILRMMDNSRLSHHDMSIFNRCINCTQTVDFLYNIINVAIALGNETHTQLLNVLVVAYYTHVVALTDGEEQLSHVDIVEIEISVTPHGVRICIHFLYIDVCELGV